MLLPKTNLNRAHDASFAKLAVGPEPRDFIVHLDLLVYYSPVFRAALTGSFEEARDKTIALPDTDVNVFELFVHWLYHQRFPSEADSPHLFALYYNGGKPSFQFNQLLKLYVFSDKYNVPMLRRQCLDDLFYYLTDEDELPDLNNVGYAIKNLNNKDPLRQMFIDMYCYYGDAECWKLNHIKGLPRSFLAEVLMHFTDFAHDGRDGRGMPEVCDYHGHSSPQERRICVDQMEKAEKAEKAKQMMTD
jgi:hypothetical protein